MNAVRKSNNYSVGYGRPPLHSRFQKGRSGNPAGRRRYTESERGRQLLRQDANRKVTIREGDKAVQITALQAAVRSLFYAAVKGKASALKMVLAAIADHDAPGEPAEPIKITWLPPAPAPLDASSMLDQLDLRHLSDEQIGQLEQLLSLAVNAPSPK